MKIIHQNFTDAIKTEFREKFTVTFDSSFTADYKTNCPYHFYCN